MYEITGYDWEYIDFKYKVNSFMKAVEFVNRLNRALCVVFLSCDGRSISTSRFPYEFRAPRLSGQKAAVTAAK